MTGASSGVSREIARALAAGGAHVLLPVRDRARGEAAARSIRDSVPDASIEICELDLTDLATVVALGETLLCEVIARTSARAASDRRIPDHRYCDTQALMSLEMGFA